MLGHLRIVRNAGGHAEAETEALAKGVYISELARRGSSSRPKSPSRTGGRPLSIPPLAGHLMTENGKLHMLLGEGRSARRIPMQLRAIDPKGRAPRVNMYVEFEPEPPFDRDFAPGSYVRLSLSQDHVAERVRPFPPDDDECAPLRGWRQNIESHNASIEWMLARGRAHAVGWERNYFAMFGMGLAWNAITLARLGYINVGQGRNPRYRGSYEGLLAA